MRIVVCLKVVRGDYISGNRNDQTKYLLNPYDEYALEAVLEKQVKNTMQVVCLSMGGENIKDALVKSMALGAEDVYWLCDKAFAGADTVATSYTLSEAIKKIGDSKLIICGEKAIDGETGQVGIGISERLGFACVTNVKEIISLDQDSVTVRTVNHRTESIVQVNYSAVLIFAEFSTNNKAVSLLALKRAQQKLIQKWSAEELGIDTDKCGMKGSKTKVKEVNSNLHKKAGRVILGDTSEQVKALEELLRKRSDLHNEL